VENKIVAGITPVILTRNFSPAKSSSGEEEAVSLTPISSKPSPSASLPTEKEKQVTEQLEKIFKSLDGPDRVFEIAFYKETNKIMVKVYDKESGDLIREIPSEKLLDLTGNPKELNGLIINEKI
jgi:flagellar protein FlaG